MACTVASSVLVRSNDPSASFAAITATMVVAVSVTVSVSVASINVLSVKVTVVVELAACAAIRLARDSATWLLTSAARSPFV